MRIKCQLHRKFPNKDTSGANVIYNLNQTEIKNKTHRQRKWELNCDPTHNPSSYLGQYRVSLDFFEKSWVTLLSKYTGSTPEIDFYNHRKKGLSSWVLTSQPLPCMLEMIRCQM